MIGEDLAPHHILGLLASSDKDPISSKKKPAATTTTPEKQATKSRGLLSMFSGGKTRLKSPPIVVSPPPPPPPAPVDGGAPKERRLSTRERVLSQSTAARERASGDGSGEPRRSFEGIGGGGGLSAIKNKFLAEQTLDEERHAAKKELRKSAEGLHGTKIAKSNLNAFTSAMEEDNAKRGHSGERADLHALVQRVETSDPSLGILDLSEHQQFLWLSPAQKLSVIDKIGAGSALTELLLDRLDLALPLAEVLAAAIKSHTKLVKLSLERNGLNEEAMVLLAGAIEGHPSLKVVQVGSQCNQELLTQAALIALLDAMEKTPQLTSLGVGKIIDPSLRRRYDAVTMKNRDLLRVRRVTNNMQDPRARAGKTCDWALEASNLRHSRPFEYGLAADISDAAERQETYVVSGSALWKAAKEEERLAIIEAFASNKKVTSLVLANALLTDGLVASKFEPMLSSNHTLTSLNLESNKISSAGFDAISRGLAKNSTLAELKLANQGLAISQAAEMNLANAVDASTSVLKVTVDLRNMRARELINNALSRNREKLRMERRRTGTESQAPVGIS